MAENKGYRKSASGRYEITAQLGNHPARRCTANPRHLVWMSEHRSLKCPRCGALLGEVTQARRQIEKGGFLTVAAAKAWKQDTESNGRRGETPLPGKVTVAEQISAYLELKRPPKVRPTTHRRYTDLARLYLTPALGHILLHLVRPDDVDALWNNMTAEGLSASTIRQARAVLHGVFRAAMKNRLVIWNPVTVSDIPEGAARKRDVVRPEHVRALLSHVQEPWRTPTLIAIFTGMRRSEICALRWDNVDLDATPPTLQVCNGLHRVPRGYRDTPGQWWSIEEPKSSASGRPFPIAPDLVQTLKVHRVAQNAQRLKLGGEAWTDLDLVCASGDGTPVNPDAFTKAVKVAVRAAGLPDGVHLHDLRHAMGTLLRLEGVPLDVVRDQLGHSTIAFTADRYGDVLPERFGAVTDAMQKHYGTDR